MTFNRFLAALVVSAALVFFNFAPCALSQSAALKKEVRYTWSEGRWQFEESIKHKDLGDGYLVAVDEDGESALQSPSLIRYEYPDEDTQVCYNWDADNKMWVQFAKYELIRVNGVIVLRLCYTWNAANQVWNVVFKYTFQYDNQGRQTEEECSIWLADSNSGSWEYLIKYTCSYDDELEKKTRKCYMYDHEDEVWKLTETRRKCYEKNAEGKTSSETDELWVDGDWVVVGRVDYTYDVNCNVDSEVFWVWSGSEWIYDGEYYYEYDKLNRVELVNCLLPGASVPPGAMGRKSMHAYQFDSHGMLTERVEHSVQSGRVTPFYKCEYVYDLNATDVGDVRGVRPLLSIAPNPTTDYLTVDLQGVPPGVWSLSLHDAVGRTVLRQSLGQHSMDASRATIDVRALPNGVYSMLIESDGRESIGANVVIQR